MDNRTRAREWMVSRCASELTGNRMGQSDVEDASTDTESGKPCDCLDSLTALLDSVRREAMEEAARECVDESRMMAILHQDDASRSAAACYRRIRALATPTKPVDEP